eukprot:IDg22809t1
MGFMYNDEFNEEPELRVSRRQFNNILLTELPHVRTSRSERGICDIHCIPYKLERWTTRGSQRYQRRGVRTYLLQLIPEMEHNFCRNQAAEQWNSNDATVLAQADLSIDYEKQAFIPVVPFGTTKDYFVQKQGLDINMFGIMNEGSKVQTNMLSTDGARHDTNSVASQLHVYLTKLDKKSVVHKFTALDLPQFSELVDTAARNSVSYIFDHIADVRDNKHGTRKLFKNLPGFRANFYYSIVIERVDDEETVLVRTSTNPGEHIESAYDLRKAGTVYPDFDDEEYFLCVIAKK